MIFSSTVSANLGMTLNSANPNTYNLDLFNAERHTSGVTHNLQTPTAIRQTACDTTLVMAMTQPPSTVLRNGLRPATSQPVTRAEG